MSDSTALIQSTDNIQLIWNERTSKYEAMDLNTGLMVRDYTPNLSSAKTIEYSQDMADMVVDLIRRGNRITKIGQLPNMPPYSAICLWRAQNPEFRRRVELAYKDRAEGYHDQAVELALEAVNSPKEIQSGIKIAVDTLKWAAEKGDNKRYGAQKDNTGPQGGVTIIIDTGVKTQEQPKQADIIVDANGEFRGFQDEAQGIVRGSDGARSECSGGSEASASTGDTEGVIINLSRDRWKEYETKSTKSTESEEGESGGS